MEDLLIQTLTEAFNFPVLLQGSLGTEEKYPDTFFTFWCADCSDGQHYDNHTTSYIWDYDLNCYSTDPLTVTETIRKAVEVLKSVGFTANGKGHDIASDEPTHTGKGITILYLEKKLEKENENG